LQIDNLIPFLICLLESVAASPKKSDSSLTKWFREIVSPKIQPKEQNKKAFSGQNEDPVQTLKSQNLNIGAGLHDINSIASGSLERDGVCNDSDEGQFDLELPSAQQTADAENFANEGNESIIIDDRQLSGLLREWIWAKNRVNIAIIGARGIGKCFLTNTLLEISYQNTHNNDSLASQNGIRAGGAEPMEHDEYAKKEVIGTLSSGNTQDTKQIFKDMYSSLEKDFCLIDSMDYTQAPAAVVLSI
jgi:hypothetical protein